MARIHEGSRFGAWTTVTKLGQGGNGEVWQACHDDGTAGAIKILKPARRDGQYRLDRFSDEIQFLLDHPDAPGILPLIDSSLSKDPRTTSWYVMPVATPLTTALGTDPRPEDVVAAIAEAAETLARLAAEGVGHRDIKPDNLFKLGNNWVIGDFGLVTYPDKNPLTEHGRKLGPTDYLAPEMRRDADHAAPEPADVWALSKTLWVLLAGGDVPPQPGPHRPTDPAYSLQDRLTYNRAHALDLLLERATHMNPETRISMAEFARELRACLAAPAEAVPSASLNELSERISSLTETQFRRSSEVINRRNDLDTAVHLFQTMVGEVVDDLTGRLPHFSKPVDDQVNDAYPLLGQRGIAYASYGLGTHLVSPGPQPKARIALAVTVRAMQVEGPVEVAALVRVVQQREDRLTVDHDIWQQIYTCPIGSAQLDNACSEIRAKFIDSFDPVLRKIAELLG